VGSPLVIAHRGASYDAPENTLAAVRLAWEQGADGVEVDVHLSADGRVVVIHDKSTKRTTGADHVVHDTSWDVLRGLDAGAWKGPGFSGERIPLLSEVLETVPPGKLLFVELKGGPLLVPAVVSLLEDGFANDRLAFCIGFDLRLLAGVRKRCPAIGLSWLLDARETTDGRVLPHEPARIAEATASGVFALGVHHAGVNDSFAAAVREAGMELHVWTVNDPQEMRRQRAFGVRSITTDRPALALGALS